MIRPHDHPAAMRHQKTHEADKSSLCHQTSHQECIHHEVKAPKREELPPQRDSSFLPFQHQIQDPCLCREKHDESKHDGENRKRRQEFGEGNRAHQPVQRHIHPRRIGPDVHQHTGDTAADCRQRRTKDQKIG